ncbi:hypothetical protein [Rathayibacter soli]|uniref:hypothetical protein n=1 Tax=Rathayibacter soli TaxID=3144168 RepID=UPI0027E4B125|nr:hypothetical protein [Glaciibacter superstes]
MSTILVGKAGMGTSALDHHQLPIIDRAAIRIGAMLIAWGRRRAQRGLEFDTAGRARADYVERVRTASAVTQQRLLP